MTDRGLAAADIPHPRLSEDRRTVTLTDASALADTLTLASASGWNVLLVRARQDGLEVVLGR